MTNVILPRNGANAKANGWQFGRISSQNCIFILYGQDARNLRKSFQAACVKVGLGVKTGPKVWGCLFTTFAGVVSGI